MFMTQKKKLTDNQRLARNKKIKRVIKIVLDVLIYGFAFFMLFGLILGSCSVGKQGSKNSVKNPLPPIARALNSPGGYVLSINDVPVEPNGETKFYYYYDSNYMYTFPGHSAILSAGMTTELQLYACRFTPAIDVDNTRFTSLGFVRSSNVYYLRLIGVTPSVYINILSIDVSNKTLLRADLLRQVFNGNYTLRLGDNPTNDNKAFYRFIYYYFGEFGLNRVTYQFPIDVTQYNYLFVDTIQENPALMGGLIFKNDNFPSMAETDEATIYKVPMFTGAFRSNGVIYTSVIFSFSSVYGRNYSGSSPQSYVYMFPFGTRIHSMDTTYRDYWFLNDITFSNGSTSTVVWRAFQYDGYDAGSSTTDSGGNIMKYVANWVGDTYTSSSPYRSIYVFYFFDSVSNTFKPYADVFPQLASYKFSDYLFFIGEGYINTLPGNIVNNESPLVTNVFTWFSTALTGLMPIFGYTFIPGISFGTLLMIPFSVTIVLFVIRLFKR